MTQTEKTNRIRSISDEVNIFHPLLKTVFTKIPSINNHEYNHGSSEFGADFILEQIDNILTEVKYTGVVVKIGNINQKNIDEIERQIKECFKISKYFNNGKKKVRISSVWVVTNGVITANAKVKINASFNEHSISFIDIEKTTQLIDEHFQNYWTEVSIQAGTILGEIEASVRNDDEKSSLILGGSHNFYIEQEIRQNDDTKRNPKKKTKLHGKDLIKILREGSNIFLEATAGGGKSKLLRMISLDLCKPNIYKQHKLLPIRFSFKEIVAILEKENLENEIKSKLFGYFDAIVEEEGVKIVLFIDSIDEAFESKDEIKRGINKLASSIENLDYVQLFLASRYLDDACGEEIRRLNFKCFELAQFSTGTIVKFLKELINDTEATKVILKDLQKREIFKELPQSPIAAILLARLINEDPKDLPSTLPELYRKYVELTTGRWEIDKNLQSQSEYECLNSILENIADYMHYHTLDCIGLTEVESYFKDYLETRNLNIQLDEFFKRSLSRCSIVDCDFDRSTFRFKHKTFMEFYYAQRMSKRHDVAIDNKIWEPYWSKVFYFYLGFKKDCPDLLEKIYTIEPKNETSRWMRARMMPEYLLAAYASPYETIERGIAIAVEDITHLTVESIHDGKGFFTWLPPMQFINFITYFSRQNLGFSFFEKALENIALNSPKSIDVNTSPYLFFIIDRALHEISGDTHFRFLQTADLDKLPTTIRLAISRYAHDGVKEVFVKKVDKQLRRAIKRSGKLYKTIEDLYEKPLNEYKTTALPK